MNPAPEWAFINSDFVPLKEARIHIHDLALQRGYGVFDFFRVKNSSPVWLEDHLRRFFFSADEMHLRCRLSAAELKTNIYRLIEKNSIPDCGIRLTLTGGTSPDGYTIDETNLIISAQLYQPPSAELLQNGIRLVTHSHLRQFPHVKSIDYLMAIWLQPKVRSMDADDVLYQHEGFISECPRANFFAVRKNGQIQTPKNNILEGITRMKLLHAAKQHYAVIEDKISLDDLKDCAEAFITSTTKGILPVSRIDEHCFAPERPVTRHLQKLFNQ